VDPPPERGWPTRLACHLRSLESSLPGLGGTENETPSLSELGTLFTDTLDPLSAGSLPPRLLGTGDMSFGVRGIDELGSDPPDDELVDPAAIVAPIGLARIPLSCPADEDRPKLLFIGEGGVEDAGVDK